MGNSKSSGKIVKCPDALDHPRIVEIPRNVNHGVCKEGTLYSVYKTQIRPFDLVFFKGNDFMSSIISFVESFALEQTSSAGYGIDNNTFTHLGMVVTTEILDDPRLEVGKLYIWESTMSGTLSDGVKNIDGESFYGVQLRDLDQVIDVYDRPDDTSIAISHITKNVIEDIDFTSIKEKFTSLFTTYNNIKYTTDPITLGATMIRCLRPIRDDLNKHDKPHIFCSELIAIIFKELGIFGDAVNPKNVVPMDFFGFDSEKIKTERVPMIIENPHPIVSLYHFTKPHNVLPQSIVSLDIEWFSSGPTTIRNPAIGIADEIDKLSHVKSTKSIRYFPTDIFESTTSSSSSSSFSSSSSKGE